MQASDGKKLEQFLNWVRESRRIVFFGGAGVSTESGIPDFRSVDGLYHQKYDFPPETILSHTFFMRNRQEFYRFYWDKMIKDAKPNITHHVLAKLEREGRLAAVVTQNIDGLHQLAGSQNVLELHGSVHRNYCMKCRKHYSLSELLTRKQDESGFVPVCDCGGVIKPDVVLYEEGLNEEVMDQAVYQIGQADMLIIGGTSLSVYPAAGFIRYYRGKRLVLINKTETSYDKDANLVLNCGLGEVFSVVDN